MYFKKSKPSTCATTLSEMTLNLQSLIEQHALDTNAKKELS